jgi:hypothetical protein
MFDDYNPPMRVKLTPLCFLLVASGLSLLFSCNSTPEPVSLKTSLLIYRFDPPAFIEYSEDLQFVKEIPFSIPPSCGLNNTFPAPVGKFLLIELNCPNGQTVLFLDTESGTATQPVSDSDSHFLAWTSDGEAAYLKVDSIGFPKIIRAYVDGKQDLLSINEFTYDLAAQPDSRDFTFTFSRGLGQGSELSLAQRDGKAVQLLYADPYHYISFARFSPDGKQIAFLKIPDTQTPFAVGELWVMDSKGANSYKIADADTGHGYAATWSPDGKRIAFVVRENPEDENADQNSDALISNIYVANVETGTLTQITNLTQGHVETPYWSPMGNTLAFNVVINGRMTVSIANAATGEVKPLETGASCCPAWMRK